jgi:nucleoside-diphosphate-sugar epimerase
MKVLVTGAQGFIGQYVVEELARRGYTPVEFDRYDKGARTPGAEFFLGDITDDVAVTEAVAHVDGFIHLAGVLGTQETIKNPNPAAFVNIQGGLNVFKAAAQYNVPGVNIAVGNHWMNNTYSITKSTMERFVAMFNTESGTKINIVRPTNCFGPRQVSFPPYGPSKVKKITPAFINAAIRNLPIGIYGDGNQVSDMIYVEDVAKTLVTAMEHAADGKVYDKAFEVGYGEPITVNEVAQTVIKVAGSTSTLEHSPMRPGEEVGGIVLADPSTLAPLGIFKKDFVTLEDGLARAIEYYRKSL